MNRNAAALAALVAGILIGTAIRASGIAPLADGAHALQSIGTLWLNALRMTLVPLIFGMVTKGVIGLDRAGGGARLLSVALPLIISLLVLAMVIGILFGLALESAWPVAQGALAPWGAAATQGANTSPSIVAMILGLLPSNPVAAAAEGNLVAIVVFAIFFGFAVSRTDPAGDGVMSRLINELAAAMIQIVHWVLLFTPIGIFILAMGLALDVGISVAGFMAELVVASCATAAIAIVVGYVLAWLLGGMSPLKFGRAILGAQAMAAGTTSSAATLPIMLDLSERKLEISGAIGGAVLPLAVSLFRFAVPFYQGVTVVLLMKAAGLTLTFDKAIVAGAILILTNIGIAGLPGAAVVAASWSAALLYLGLPLGVLPLLIALIPLPDILITVGNVTADLALAVIVDRILGRSSAVPVPAPAE